MNNIIKQHLLVASRENLEKYFSDVVSITPETNFRGEDSKFEIPTWPIKKQLDEIVKNNPKTGFVWYFIRKVLNNPDGTFNIEIGFRQEMIWIKENKHDPYIMKTINDLLQFNDNSRVLEQK